MRFVTTLLSSALLASVCLAQGTDNTTTAELTAVDVAYADLGLGLGGNAGFGINLTATALLTATYSRGDIVNGRTYPPARLTTQPAISVSPSTTFNTSATFTLTLSDASALADPDPEGNFRHWLANGLTLAPGNASDALVLTGGTTVTDYAAPGPLAGSGVHRYAFLLFEEPDGFAPPANLSAAGVAPAHWYVSDYVQQTGVTIVAASFFLAENADDAAPTEGASSTAASAPIRTRTSVPLSASATAFLSSVAGSV